MKFLLTLFVILLIGVITSNGQTCTCNFTYSATSDTLSFTNQSSVSNAHYYWNFGDGDGSNEINPVYVFPDNGDYLVILYGYDTISGCSNYYQQWISVIRIDTLTCHFSLTDSIESFGIDTELVITTLDSNCGGLNFDCAVAGPGQNYCSPLLNGSAPALFLAATEAFSNDAIYGSRIFKEYYKTVPYQFNPGINYQNCSSNFEVTINYQPNGALVSLNAMNKVGIDTFWVTGLGNPIPLAGHSVSYLYPYVSYDKTFPWLIEYTKTDSLHSCSVTGTQEILIRNPNYSFPVNCVISSQPQDVSAKVGSNVQFIISTQDTATRQWQQDAGLGYVNLTDAGQYSGVNTDTLTVSDIQLTMNNYHYRCVVSDACHNTSSMAVLGVSLTGINDIELNKIKVYPDPVSDFLYIDGNSDFKIQLLNTLGQTIVAKTQTNMIDMNRVPEGIYYLLFYTDYGQLISAKKIIKD